MNARGDPEGEPPLSGPLGHPGAAVPRALSPSGGSANPGGVAQRERRRGLDAGQGSLYFRARGGGVSPCFCLPQAPGPGRCL